MKIAFFAQNQSTKKNLKFFQETSRFLRLRREIGFKTETFSAKRGSKNAKPIL